LWRQRYVIIYAVCKSYFNPILRLTHCKTLKIKQQHSGQGGNCFLQKQL